METQELGALQEPQEAEERADQARGAEVDSAEARSLEARVSGGLLAEDETQLAAIRELMEGALARGVWLTLGEIAEATEFGEASISAQLRHLRKAHHGGHRVEKRRRQAARACAPTHAKRLRAGGFGQAAARKRGIREARRAPIVWEYRVLPPA
jgi:hypothetical protein